MNMTKEEHKKRHQKLHKNLDELLADFIENTTFLPSKTPIVTLLKWSHKQTQEPDHDNL